MPRQKSSVQFADLFGESLELTGQAEDGRASGIRQPGILSNDQQPAHYLNEVIEHRVMDRVPVDVAASSYEIVPSSAAALRRRLFEMVLYDRQRDRIARRLLVWIDDLRDRHGRPDDEPRHPWLAIGVSWPLVEQPQELKPS